MILYFTMTTNILKYTLGHFCGIGHVLTILHSVIVKFEFGPKFNSLIAVKSLENRSIGIRPHEYVVDFMQCRFMQDGINAGAMKQHTYAM